MLMVWLVGSFLVSGAYCIYAIYMFGLLRDPSTLSDMASGMAAFISLPSIFILLYQQKKADAQHLKEEERKLEANEKREIERVGQHKRDGVAQMFSAIDEVYFFSEKLEKYGFTLLHLLQDIAVKKEGAISEPDVLWEGWRNKKDVFGYLRTFYFVGRSNSVRNYIRAEIRKMDSNEDSKTGPGLVYALHRLREGYSFYEALLDELDQNYGNQSPVLTKRLRAVVKNDGLYDVVMEAREILKSN